MNHDIKVEFDKIKNFLMKFEGGEIFLSKEYYNLGIAVLHLNNPQKKNALTGKMMIDLRNCVEELENWKEGKVVILCGEGNNFCSGGDLDFAKKTGTPKEAIYMSSWMMDTLSRLRSLPFFSVCLINGPTLGGGVEIAVHCDFILAADNVKFGFVHGKMGITTAWGGGTNLIERLGVQKASKILLGSQILTASDCMSVGIAEAIISSSNILVDALEWLKTYTIHHYEVTQAYKKLIVTYRNSGPAEALTCEKILVSNLWGGEQNQKMLAKNIKHISD